MLSRVRESQLRTASGDVVALERVRRFQSPESNTGVEADLLRPSAPLLVGQEYSLELKDAGAVHFWVTEEIPTEDVALTLRLEELLMNEPQFHSSCYGGPIAERSYLRAAKLNLRYDHEVPLIVVATAHDAVSETDVEETTSPIDVRYSDDEGLSLFLPMPDGVDPCLRVEIIDYAGRTLFDEQALCLESTPQVIGIATKAYNPELLPTASPVDEPAVTPGDVAGQPEPKPTTGERTSTSCGIAARSELGVDSAWFALALLSLARRRSAR